MLSDIVIRLRSLFRYKRVEGELDDELRFHIDRQVEKLMRSGLAREEALRSARFLVGGVDQLKEECRDARGVRPIETLLQDVHYGLRILRQRAGFTTVAILTLALGVGANTAMFSIVNAVLLRSLPFRQPGRLVRIFFNNPGVGLRDVPFSVPEWEDLRNRSGVFESISAVTTNSINLTGGAQPERLEFLWAGFDYFQILGVAPQIGRLFDPGDSTPGFSPFAVISDSLWRRAYAADPGILGRTIHLDNDPYTIVGVLPPGFRHPGPTISGDVDVFLAAAANAQPFPRPARDTRILPSAVGRLKPGLTLQQAQARLADMAKELRRDFPADYPAKAQWTIEIQPLQESLVGRIRPTLLVLLGAIVLVVFVVSLNIANLLLAHASTRQQEIAVRAALGASRERILSQVLTESALLAGIGCITGITTAFTALRFILRFIPPNIPRLNEVSIDWTVLLFALLVSVLSGLLFGLAPALHSARFSLSAGAREGARGCSYSLKTGRFRDVLVVSELALAVVLMIGAGLLLRTLQTLLQQDPGFNPQQVVAANIWLPVPNDPKLDPYSGIARRTAFIRELLRRARAIPGVDLAATTSNLPTIIRVNNNDVLAIEGRSVESSESLRAELIRVSPDYFQVMRAPLLRGRIFSETDQDGRPPVAVIDETTARRYWAGQNALGRRLRFGQDASLPWISVVGIVKDIKNDGLDIDGVPHIYISVYQRPDRAIDSGRDFSLVLRTSLPAAALEPRIRSEIQSVDPSLPVYHVSSMNDVLDASLATRRFSARLVGAFAALALLLSAIGVYGLLAYAAGQRSREIGLRIALGATGSDILKMIVSKGVLLAAIGIVAGVFFAASTSSLMASLLYGVRPRDPLVFFSVPLVLFIAGVLASVIPAWRAAQVDPMIALREA